MIEFIGLRKSFGPKVVLDGIDLTLRDGEITYIIGTSGTGKSVLIKHAVGLLRPDSGKVVVDGQDVTNYTERQWWEIRRRYVLVFQHPALFDSLKVVDNVALPLRKHFGLSREEARRRALEFLRLVGLEAKGEAMPSDLGVTERKRVSVARALTLEPDWAILDEPTTGLDVMAMEEVDNLIRHLRHGLGKTVVVVSHDLRSIFGVAERIIFLYKGKVRLDGPKEAFLASQDPVVQQFIRGEPTGPLEIA